MKTALVSACLCIGFAHAVSAQRDTSTARRNEVAVFTGLSQTQRFDATASPSTFSGRGNHADFTDYIAEDVSPTGAASFRGPVFVLANLAVFSSAEDFVLAMRSLPTVTIVGDTTGGASGGPIVRELANGWTYQLSEWIEYTAERRMFEGIGLAPDIVVKASASDAAASVDAALEHARALAIGM